MTSPSATPSVTPSVTFVCCIESGGLEAQTVRMIESLRRWGGRFADAPVVAVTPRFGPPLSGITHAALQRLNVEYLRFRADNPYAWKGFLNKHYSMAAVESACTTDCVGWLDSDLLILGEPDQLLLAPDEEFAACAPDKNFGTTGPDDPCDPYWRAVCEVLGVDLEALPWIVTEQEGDRIRFYMNSGVFVYRRSTGFSKHHLDNTLKFFEARLTSRTTQNSYFTQHIMGITVVQQGLKWRSLPYSHNYPIGSKIYPDWYRRERLQEAKIFHYHDAMWMPFWPTLLECLQDTHPEVAAWLEPQGALKAEAVALPWRVLGKGLKLWRTRQERSYRAQCRLV